VSVRPIHMAKETYSYGKRGLFIWQKRPTNTSIPEVCLSVSETWLYGKRDLFMWQKRPVYMEKRPVDMSYSSLIIGNYCSLN